jgi:hypothetical protein
MLRAAMEEAQRNRRVIHGRVTDEPVFWICTSVQRSTWTISPVSLNFETGTLNFRHKSRAVSVFNHAGVGDK